MSLGAVVFQLPTGQSLPLAEGYSAWLGYLDTHPEDLPRFQCQVNLLSLGGTFRNRPILHPGKTVHDGKHRLLAAYGFALQHGLPSTLEVYWRG